MRFEIVAEPPVVTSARKLDWHARPFLVFYALLMVLFPFITRYRWLCGLWYRRPPHPP